VTDLRARIMLVGEQPGDQEDKQGRPFVEDGTVVFVTQHPSALLRMDDDAQKRRQYLRMVDDLRRAARSIG
jgi:uracil-DNA glycosylase